MTDTIRIVLPNMTLASANVVKDALSHRAAYLEAMAIASRSVAVESAGFAAEAASIRRELRHLEVNMLKFVEARQP